MKRLSLLVTFGLIWLAAATGYAADSRADFLKLIDRPRVALAPETKELPGTNGLVQFHFSFAADAAQRVPGILLKRAGPTGRRPAVIVLHGTGGTKEGELPLLRELAEKDFVAVAIDGRHHGERTKAGKGSVEYQDAIVRAWREPGEHPLYYDTVWDVMRLVDYLETRNDVDAKRIGLIGISKGGIETYLTAAVDPRIAAAVPCIGVQSFRWALDNNKWQARVGTISNAFNAVVREAGSSSYASTENGGLGTARPTAVPVGRGVPPRRSESGTSVVQPDTAFVQKFYDRVVPGIYGEFDGPAMLPLIAPRPLMTINGDSDDRTPLPGLKECTDAAQQAYHAAGADDRLVVRIQEHTGHRVNYISQQAAEDWFIRWLKQ